MPPSVAAESTRVRLKRDSTGQNPAPPWHVSDELWELVEPLLPKRQGRIGRRRLPDRPALEGILYVLLTGTAWQQLRTDLGFGSGFTCWRRLGEWQEAGVWEELRELLVAHLPAADRIEWPRVSIPERQLRARV